MARRHPGSTPPAPPPQPAPTSPAPLPAPGQPTPAKPGSAAKIEAMRARLLRREPLFHPADAPGIALPSPGTGANARHLPTGVSWDQQTHRWAARITVNGKRRRLGRFATLAEAVAAIEGARAALSG